MLAGIGGIVLAIRTLRVIERQSEHMANTERAWVLVDKFEEPPLSDGVERPEMLEFFAGRPMAVVHYKIYGNTPARIVSVHVRFHLVNRKDNTSEPDLPDEPVYHDSFGILRDLDSAFVKAAGQEVHLPALFEGDYITSVQLTEIGKGTLFPCIYGRVKYWDSFEREHETRFCYIYRVSHGGPLRKGTGQPMFPSEFRHGGPRAYIRNT